MDIRETFVENQGAVSDRRTKSEVGGAKGSLGNATELRTPPRKTHDGYFVDCETAEVLKHGELSEKAFISEARKIRFDLQDTASHILYGYYPQGAPVNNKGYEVHHRTCTCHKFLNSNTAQILKSKEHNKTFFGGVMSCANARTCPVCAKKINERKSNEMRMAFNQAIAKGLNISMLTFTAPHDSSDKIEDLIPKISNALAFFWRGSPAKSFKKRFGIVGHIRSFEVRYGVNGWHPHFHIIIFSDHKLPVTSRTGHFVDEPINQDEQWQWVLERWQNMCKKAGLKSPNKYGMDLQNAGEAGAYITKFGSDDEILETKKGKRITWDMADEMTKGNTKIGRKGSFSPWDILSNAGNKELPEDERKKYRMLFLFYSRAMYRVTLIKWSRGLRDLFDLGAEKTDEEILNDEENRADLLCNLSPAEWRFIYLNRHRALILDLADNGGRLAVARFLFEKMYTGRFDDYYFKFINRDKNHVEVSECNAIGETHYFVNGIRKVDVKKRELERPPLIKKNTNT